MPSFVGLLGPYVIQSLTASFELACDRSARSKESWKSWSRLVCSYSI